MKLLRHPDAWNRGAIGLSVDEARDGLLFCMDKEAPWPVEMIGVNFPIDAYWLSESGMVIEHAELFPGMPAYWPEQHGRYVLELHMLEIPRYHIGDIVEMPET